MFYRSNQEKHKKKNAYHMPSLGHSFGTSYDSDNLGGKKPYEVLNAGYQFKHRFL